MKHHLIASILVAAAAAQYGPWRGGPGGYSGFPSCSQSCFTSSSVCSNGDFACYCSSASIDSVNSCISSSSCSAADKENAYLAIAQACVYSGVTVTAKPEATFSVTSGGPWPSQWSTYTGWNSGYGPFGPNGWGPYSYTGAWSSGPWTSWWGTSACPPSTWSGWTTGPWSTSPPWTAWTACTATTSTTSATTTITSSGTVSTITTSSVAIKVDQTTTTANSSSASSSASSLAVSVPTSSAASSTSSLVTSSVAPATTLAASVTVSATNTQSGNGAMPTNYGIVGAAAGVVGVLAGALLL